MAKEECEAGIFRCLFSNANTLTCSFRAQKRRPAESADTDSKSAKPTRSAAKCSNPPQARIIIIRAWRQQLRDLTPEDVHKEGFNNFTEFRQAWIQIYGTWNPDQIVTACEFRLLTQQQKYRPRRNRPSRLGV